MSDLKWFRVLLAGQALLVLWLILGWVTAAPAGRWQRLSSIAQAEGITVGPPLTLLRQAEWLLTARLARLQGLSVLLGLAIGIGLAEGWARRRQDVLGGFRLTWWVCGTSGLVLFPGMVGVYLVLPVPFPLTSVGSLGLAAFVGLVGYGLALGKPSIP